MAIAYDQLSGDRREKIVRKRSSLVGASTFGERVVPGVPMGAEPEKPEKLEVEFLDINRNLSKDDTRVKILVPPKYITEFLEGPNGEIANIGGILFPYTPSVSYDAKSRIRRIKTFTFKLFY